LGEAAPGVGFRVEGDLDAGVTQLGDHGVDVRHAEVDHPCLLGAAEFLGIEREGFEGGVTGFLLPGVIAGFGVFGADAEMGIVPGFQCGGVFGPEEEAAYSSDALHGWSFVAVGMSGGRRFACPPYGLDVVTAAGCI